MMPNTYTNKITIRIFKVTTTIIINITHSTIITTTTPIITRTTTINIIMKIIIIQIDKIWDREWKRSEEIRKIRLVRCWSKFKIRIRNNLLTIRFLSGIIVIGIEITTQTLILFRIITLTITIIIIITIMIATILYKTTRRIIMIIIMKNTTI